MRKCQKSCFQIISVIILLLSVSTVSPAQNTDTANKSIVLNISVTDYSGKPITGLKVENFKLSEGKMQKTITSFSGDDAPMTIGVLFDKSSSTNTLAYNFIGSKLADFFKQGNQENEYFLMSFNSTQEILFDFTQNPEVISQGLERLTTTETKGRTRFYDSIKAALEKISQGKYSKRALIVISDGEDTESISDFKEIKNLLKKNAVPIYAIKTNTIRSIGSPSGHNEMKELADINGGILYIPHRDSDFQQIFLRLIDRLRNQYSIEFQAGEPSQRDEWREIKIKVELPPEMRKIGRVYVHTREGYYLNAANGQ